MIDNLEAANLMNTRFLKVYYNLINGKDDKFVKENAPRYDESVELLPRIHRLRLDAETNKKVSKERYYELVQQERFLTQYMKPIYTAKATNLIGTDIERETIWLNILRFSTLFLNDGRINLLSKQALQDAMNGHFVLKHTNNSNEVCQYIKNIENVDLTSDQLKVLHNVYLAKAKGNKINIDQFKKISEYFEYDKITGEIKDKNLGWNITTTPEGDIKIKFYKENDISPILVLHSNGAMRYTLEYEADPIVVYSPNVVFKYDEKGKKIAVNEIAKMPPDEIFDKFRNANAHSSRQNFNKNKRSFSFKFQNGCTMVYTYGWLEGFTSMFVREIFGKIYGPNSQYKAMPGWKKDAERKKYLLPNNEVPLILNKNVSSKFKSPDEIEDYLKARKFLRVTINDDASLLAVQDFIDNTLVDLYENANSDDKKNYFFIKSQLKKAKLKDYSIVEIIPDNVDEYVNYWRARLADIPDFYSKPIFDQVDIIHKIDKINKYNLAGVNSYNKYRFNKDIINEAMELSSADSINTECAGTENIIKDFRIPGKMVDEMRLLKPELAPLIANMMVYSALINSGYADVMCSVDEKGEFTRVNKQDLQNLAGVDFSGFDFYQLDKNGKKSNCFSGTGPSTNLGDAVTDKRLILRFMRHALAHGRVEVLDTKVYKQNADDIRLRFTSNPTNYEGSFDNCVEVNLGRIVGTFDNPTFTKPTTTKLKHEYGNLNYKKY